VEKPMLLPASLWLGKTGSAGPAGKQGEASLGGGFQQDPSIISKQCQGL